MFFAGHHLFTTSFLIDLQTSKSFRLEADLVLHSILLFESIIILPLLTLVLLFDHSGLLGVLLFLKHECFGNTFLLLVALLGNHIVILGHHSFLLIVHSDVEDLLLNFLFIPLLQASDITSSLLGLLNLFPSFHFLLFKKGDSISEELGISFNTKNSQRL